MNAKDRDVAQRLRGALDLEIRRLSDVRSRLGAVDDEILAAAFETFEDDLGALLWLSEKQLALGGKIPMEVASTPQGRKSVLAALRAIDYGIPL